MRSGKCLERVINLLRDVPKSRYVFEAVNVVRRAASPDAALRGRPVRELQRARPLGRRGHQGHCPRLRNPCHHQESLECLKGHSYYFNQGPKHFVTL